MTDSNTNIQASIEAVSRIPVVPTILEVVCRTTGMGFAAIARVTEERWVACSVRDEIAFGLQPGGELKLETTICHEIRQSHEAVVIDHVAEDEMYCRHHTPVMYGFQSYISMPIFLKDGSFFGTLCSIDPRPARLKNPETIGMFRLFADLISFHLSALEDLDFSEDSLSEERKTSELREQFIAILGHDLRNPLGAVLNSAELLLMISSDEDVRKLSAMMKSSAYRMAGLVDNMLDFASGRLGGGIVLNRNVNNDLEKALLQIIEEMLSVWPDRSIETHFNLDEPVYCDEDRIAQLFSNLLSNALSHGAPDAPIIVRASSDDEFILSVTNAGDKIPPVVMNRLFQPFSRGIIKPGQNGLGLGLYIASEIARAHGGTLNATSTEEETCFTLQLPLS